MKQETTKYHKANSGLHIDNPHNDNMNSNLNERGVFSVKELAEFLGISKTIAYRLVHTDGFPVLRLGKRILIPIDPLDTWISNRVLK